MRAIPHLGNGVFPGLCGMPQPHHPPLVMRPPMRADPGPTEVP